MDERKTMAIFKRKPQEVADFREKVYETDPSNYPGMTYEQGIAETLDWILGNSDEPPSVE
jgi:hypothetical protein